MKVGDIVEHCYTKEVGIVVEEDQCEDNQPLRWVKVEDTVRCFAEVHLRKVEDETR